MARCYRLLSPAASGMAIVAVSFFLFSLSLGFNESTLSFNEGYSALFGHHNIHISDDQKSIQLHLDRSSGSGFISKDMYHHGFFSAKIKLLSEYTAGIVVAFYTSNGDVFEKTHDELDFEFLGKDWRVQTNVYGNGSTSRGREERYLLWFDPSQNFHSYSILWTRTTIIFSVDDVPIREVVRTAAMGGDYPSKPMSVYATIWDGSDWATQGGKYKADYSYAPFVSEFSELVLKGCTVDPIDQVSDRCSQEEAGISEEQFAAVMTPEKREAMEKFRSRYMAYSHCYDQESTALRRVASARYKLDRDYPGGRPPLTGAPCYGEIVFKDNGYHTATRKILVHIQEKTKKTVQFRRIWAEPCALMPDESSRVLWKHV